MTSEKGIAQTGLDFGYSTLEIGKSKIDVMKNFEELEVYQAAYKLAVLLYKDIHNAKEYDLVKETMRSARSIATNIAEGFSRRSDKKIFSYHLGVAMGEANEMMVHVSFLSDFGVLPKSKSDLLKQKYEILAKKLNVLKEKNLRF